MATSATAKGHFNIILYIHCSDIFFFEYFLFPWANLILNIHKTYTQNLSPLFSYQKKKKIPQSSSLRQNNIGIYILYAFIYLVYNMYTCVCV